jgi:hypothetical protein
MTKAKPDFKNIAYQSLLGLGTLLGVTTADVLFNETLNRLIEHDTPSAFATAAAAVGIFAAAYVCLDGSAKSR